MADRAARWSCGPLSPADPDAARIVPIQDTSAWDTSRREVGLHRAWLILALAACTPTVPTNEPAPVTAEERQALWGDVRHLLGEALAAHRVGDRGLAKRKVEGAHAVFRDHLVEPFRALDAREALALEYALGRFAAALHDRGEATARWRDLDARLAAAATRTAEASEAPAAP